MKRADSTTDDTVAIFNYSNTMAYIGSGTWTRLKHVHIVCAAGAMRSTVGVRYLDSIKVTSWHTLFCSLQIRRHSFSKLKRGLIMASGGSSVLDEYEWETLPDMLVARCYSVAAYHEGRLYVFGRSCVCVCVDGF